VRTASQGEWSDADEKALLGYQQADSEEK
jgi:hypothetical protein